MTLFSVQTVSQCHIFSYIIASIIVIYHLASTPYTTVLMSTLEATLEFCIFVIYYLARLFLISQQYYWAWGGDQISAKTESPSSLTLLPPLSSTLQHPLTTFTGCYCFNVYSMHTCSVQFSDCMIHLADNY